ncbi:MAG TPA: ABC transporter substrate-binding protein [Alphaproteobacteria bacterium]|nr:ABC transporter substrate-binding protein [Alphaproteobacteria bacterium]
MSDLPVTVACWNYDRTRALMDGRVPVEGCDPRFISLGPEEVFFRAFRHGEFDVSELSFSSYLMATARGSCPYIAIPVFISRAFRHSGIYIRTDRGIEAPADLKGRLVGVPEYQVTAAVWIRGVLQHEYGLRPADVEWRSGGIEDPGRHEKLPIELPDDVKIEAIAEGKTLSAMLEAGEIDALVSPRSPSCFDRGAAHVARLFPDFRTLERAWFAKTQIFPIMHVIGIRKELAAAEPWLGASLMKAFEAAKRLAYADLREVAALKATLPWVTQEYEETVALMGTDYWPYGIADNRPTLDAFLKYHHEQGLSPAPAMLDEIFLRSAMETVKV